MFKKIALTTLALGIFGAGMVVGYHLLTTTSAQAQAVAPANPATCPQGGTCPQGHQPMSGTAMMNGYGAAMHTSGTLSQTAMMNGQGAAMRASGAMSGTAPMNGQGMRYGASANGGGQGPGARGRMSAGGGNTTAPQMRLHQTSPQPVTRDQWFPVNGTVASTTTYGFALTTAAGERWVQAGPTWNWSQTLSVGDAVTVFGFDEGGMFVAAEVNNTTTGQIYTLRTDAGLPLWNK